MKGGRVPEHIAATLTPQEGEVMAKLLHEVAADGGFPLNEMEEQVVEGFLGILEDGAEERVS